MTIDERIQALTESVELLASFHRDTEASFQRVDAALEKLSAHVDTIAQFVIIHEARNKRLEGNGQSPE